MASGQSLNLEQRLSLRLSLQQLRFVKLLELNAPELEESVKQELDDNPALDGDSKSLTSTDEPAPDRDSQKNFADFYSDSGASSVDYVALAGDNSLSIYDFLREQLRQRNLKPEQFRIAEYVVDSLDRNGYLPVKPAAIADDLTFNEGIETTVAEVEEALKVVQELEPYGVGASSLQECLEIQLRHMPESDVARNAFRIVQEEFREFSLRHDHKLMSRLRLSEGEVREAVALIRSLNPKPGAAVGGDPSDHSNVIIPDFIVAPGENGELNITLNNHIPELAINESFSEAVRMLKSHAEERKATRQEEKNREFILSRYNDARDFIKVLKRRQDTMMEVMTAIVSIQKDYFETADLYKLRTMMLKDVSALTGLDFSVISRATANKYVALPWGVFPLRFFFSDSVSSESQAAAKDDERGGESSDSTNVLTNRKIEATIRELVENEDKKHPLSDEKLKEMIVEKGFDVSRRTIAKYRDRIGIPVARLRKEM